MITELSESDLPELEAFLVEGFGEKSAPFFEPKILRWKYLSQLDNSSPLSFISRAQGRIVAHVGLVRTRFGKSFDQQRAVPAAHPIDWLANAGHPAAGVSVMLEAFGSVPVQYVVGGTEIAKRAHRALKYQEIAPVKLYRRTLRITHPLRSAQGSIARRFARTIKNVSERSTCRGTTPNTEIKLSAVDKFSQETIDAICPRFDQVSSLYDAKTLNRFLKFPTSEFQGYLLEHNHVIVGYSVLRIARSNGPVVGYIASCVLNSQVLDFWNAAYREICKNLHHNGAEIVHAFGSDPFTCDVLESAGFCKFGERELFLRDPKNALGACTSIRLCRMDGDHAIR